MERYNCTEQFRYAQLSTDTGKALLVVYFVVIIFIIISNTLLIMGLIKTSQVKCYTHRFLLVIAVSDLCVAFVDFPLTIATNNILDPSCKLMKAADIVSGFLDTFTVLNTFGMGVDRYIFIMKPETKKRYSRKFTFELYILVSFAISITVNGLAYDKIDKFTSDKTPFILILLSAILVAFMIAMLYVNIRLILYINNHARSMRRMSAHRQPTPYSARAAKTIGYISIVLVIAYFPIIIKNAIVSYYFMETPAEINFRGAILIHIWLAVPWYCYSGLNSTIFMMRNRRVKRYLKNNLRSVKQTLYLGKKKTVTITDSNA